MDHSKRESKNMIIKKLRKTEPVVMDGGEVSGIYFFPMNTRKDGAPNFAMRLFEIKPLGHTPKHTHGWEHEVVIISGSGYVLKEDEKISIEKDDFILVPPGLLHQFQAGKEGMSMVCVVPNEGQPK